MSLLLALIGVVVGVVVASNLLLRWNELRYGRRRNGCLPPPGTMGWPLFGETTEFLNQGMSFMKERRLRYGRIFRTHVLGCPTVVCMDPDLNRRMLLQGESSGLVPGYPQSMQDILGRNNIGALHGSMHRFIRGAMLGLVHPAAIRASLLPKIDAFMRSHLDGWSGSVVDIQAKTKEVTLLSMLRQIAGITAGPLSDALNTEFCTLVLGTISLPINLPGTRYYQGLQARKKLVSMLQKIITERRSTIQAHGDMLEALLTSGDDGTREKLSDEQIIDLIMTIIYDGYETMSTTSMMAVKYLSDHPRALQELRREHLDIRKGKSPEEAINYEDFKSMAFTRAVIFETLRLATVVNGLLRKTTQNVEMNGFVIPKGWRIYVYTREINYDSFMYSDPMTFNPWRWLEKNMESHPHFMLFGGGSRMCPGKELGTAEIATFLHYFVTRYRLVGPRQGRSECDSAPMNGLDQASSPQFDVPSWGVAPSSLTPVGEANVAETEQGGAGDVMDRIMRRWEDCDAVLIWELAEEFQRPVVDADVLVPLSNARAIRNGRMKQGDHIMCIALTCALFKPWDRKYKEWIMLAEGKYEMLLWSKAISAI
ncbi:cytochrome P450 85A1 [Triticum aestivum]|uniref:cytochrome P450 85A1 n=1 Tax=Triticum aestivum TaxID=4565 RepID=UPI001D014F24|nr:cytochrome P450 85A1-like [Triticum aestivum]